MAQYNHNHVIMGSVFIILYPNLIRPLKEHLNVLTKRLDEILLYILLAISSLLII